MTETNENGHTNITCNYRALPVGCPGCICYRTTETISEDGQELVRDYWPRGSASNGYYCHGWTCDNCFKNFSKEILRGVRIPKIVTCPNCGCNTQDNPLEGMSMPETTNAKLASQSYDDKFEQMKNKSVYAKLGAYENIRILARILCDDMKTTAGSDQYIFDGSMNSVEDLKEALSHFDMDYRE